LLCGLLILKINRLNKAEKSSELAALCFWFYNPITITIASRGNAESIMSFLVLAFILLLKNNYFLMSGLVYALSIHFKIYPG
jgi:phosphatidylinositol glycan class M